LIFLSPTLSSRSIFKEALTKLPKPQRVAETWAVIGLTATPCDAPSNRVPDG